MSNILPILDSNVRVMVDCIGYGEADGFIEWTDQDRVALVVELFRRGDGEQMTISHDLIRPSQLSAWGGDRALSFVDRIYSHVTGGGTVRS